MPGKFLSAEWRKLIMANYIVDPGVLKKYLPNHTQIDLYKGNCYISLVGFMFCDTRVSGIKFPFHTNFEEVNLRFYVRRQTSNEIRRGVVFIREIVPRFMISTIANLIYKEHYSTMRMKHTWEINDSELKIGYQWEKADWQSLSVIAQNKPSDLIQGSEAEFITEHFWGYAGKNNGKTIEYAVEHPRWKIYPVQEFDIKCNFEKVYGPDFSFLNGHQPSSVFLAEGSKVIVRKGKLIVSA